MASLRQLSLVRSGKPRSDIAVRDVIAAALDVGPERLGRDTSLVDAIETGALDLIALEEAFDIVLSPRALSTVRTYGDLLDAIHEALESYGDGAEAGTVMVRWRLVGPAPASRLILERTVAFTSPAADVVVEEALVAGPGSTLVLTIVSTISELSLGWLERIFTRLDGHGVRVSARFEYLGASPPPSHSERNPPLTLVPSGLRVTRPLADRWR